MCTLSTICGRGVIAPVCEWLVRWAVQRPDLPSESMSANSAKDGWIFGLQGGLQCPILSAGEQ